MKKLLPIIISVVLMITNNLVANASENVLRGVELKSSPTVSDIEVVTTTPTRMSKTIISSDRIIINIPNTIPAKNVYTKFNGKNIVGNIIVEPLSNDTVNILVQGENVSFANIIYKEPNSLQKAQDNVSNMCLTISNALYNNSHRKTLQYGFFGLLFLIILGEIKFIKSKYFELKNEEKMMKRDIKETSDFDDYLLGYGNMGLKKPYTTPTYGVPKNASNIRANYINKLQQLQTSETLTLNKLLKAQENEDEIINRILNEKPSFGSLSNRTTMVKPVVATDEIPLSNEIKTVDKTNTTSNPLMKLKMKKHVKYLEEMSKLYKENAQVSLDNEIKKSLNKVC